MRGFSSRVNASTELSYRQLHFCAPKVYKYFGRGTSFSQRPRPASLPLRIQRTRLVAVLNMASNDPVAAARIAQVAAAHIDQGSLAAIFDDTPDRIRQPLVQCVQVKPIAAQAGAPERYRVVFSDIRNYVQTMLATGANSHVTGGALHKGVFARLKAYQANAIKGKK
jgi:hypothetical protein